MEKTFKFNLVKILQEVNGEPDLIPYWIKLDLLYRGIPIEVDPLHVRDPFFTVRTGTLSYFEQNGFLEIKWIANKN